MSEPLSKDGVSLFLHLEKEVRTAKDVRPLSFIICNLTKRLFPYTQSLVWQKGIMGNNIIAISATSSINHKSPYIVWLEKNLLPWLIKKYGLQTTVIEKKELADHLVKPWNGYLTDNVIYCPFENFSADAVDAGVLFINSEPWNEAQLQLLSELRSLYQHAWQLVSHPEQKKKLSQIFSKRKRIHWLLGTALALLLLFLVPIRQTVLAPAEVAPRDPILVSSSIDGIIQSIKVQPNQNVKKGQVLFTLDKIILENKYQQAQQAVAVAQERYRRAYQDAYNDPKAKEELSVLQQEMDKANNELQYAKLLLERSEIKTNEDGIIIFSSPKYWLGRPIKVGEQVMLLAPKDNKKLDINVPQTDMIQIQPGDEVEFFPDINPLSALKGTVDYASFVAEPTATNQLDYFVSASFAPNQDIPRYGAHGTAKLFGKRVSLFFYLFKRPLVYLQSKLGI